MKIRIGTRGSDLAMTQTRSIRRRLEEHGHTVEIEIIKTDGDQDQVRPFAELGPAGIFVRSLEQALVEGRVDLAVHSYKDLPSVSPAELIVAAMPQRVDVRDRLLIAEAAHDPAGRNLPLKPGARIGSSAARRSALLRDLRPDVTVHLLRGNVPTRVQKLLDGQYDAILLASAGLDRLAGAAERGEIEPVERPGIIEVDLDATRFVPAPSQGALALQVRAADAETRAAVAALDDVAAHRGVRAERALLAKVEAGCQVPFGAWCREESDGWHLSAYLERDGVSAHTEQIGAVPEDLVQRAYAALVGEVPA
ncbi:MAG: hydroxymethylbilane synthase [Planctomycetota bacterium]